MRKVREISACNLAATGVGFFLRRSGQPSRLKPVGRIVEATRKFVRLGDGRQAGAANLWSRSGNAGDTRRPPAGRMATRGRGSRIVQSPEAAGAPPPLSPIGRRLYD